jgi:hypothetical protein
MNFDSYADFSKGALDSLQKLGGSLDLLESRMPKLAGAIYRGIGAGVSQLDANLQNTKTAVAEIDKMLSEQMKRVADTRRAEISAFRGISQQLYNDMLKNGKATRKMMAELGDEEKDIYREMLQRQMNDMKKAVPKMKVLKHALFQMDPDELKKAIKAPYEAQIEGFRRLKNSAAGRMMGAMIPGTQAMKKGVEKAKNWFKDLWGGDIWTTILKVAVSTIQKVADTIKKIFTFDVFNFMRQKFSEIKALYESIPGYAQASAAYQNIQGTLSQIRREFGGSVQQSRELTEAIYGASNATILVEDNARALLAVQEAGYREVTQTAQAMEQVAIYSKAWGVSETQVAQLLRTNRTNLGMTAEEAFSMAASAGIFADRLAQSGVYGASAGQFVDVLSQYADVTERYYQSARGTAYETSIVGTVQRDLMALRQLEAEANISDGFLTNLYSGFGTLDGANILTQMLGDPTLDVEAAVREGRMPELMQRLFDEWGNIMGDSDRSLVFQEYLNSLGLDSGTMELVTPYIERLSGYTDMAKDSVLGYAESLGVATTKASTNRTELQKLTGEIEAMANGFSIGGIRLGEVSEIMTVFDERLGVITQGTGLLSGVADSVFGPASWIVKLITGAPLALAAIGGFVGDFDEQFSEIGGGLGSFFQFGKDTFDNVWPQVEAVLKDTWDGIYKFFTDKSMSPNGDQTLFGMMLTTGVDWVRNNVPAIIRQVTEVAEELLFALSEAFSSLEDSGIGSAMATLFTTALTGAIPIITGAWDVFVNMAKAFMGVLREVLADNELRSSISNFVTELFSVFTGAMDDAGGLLSDAFGTLKDYAMPFFQEIGEAITLGMMGAMADALNLAPLREYVDRRNLEIERERALAAYPGELSGRAPSGGPSYGGGNQDYSLPTSSGDVNVETLLSALTQAESGGTNRGANAAGAVGHFQMLPDTATTAYRELHNTTGGGFAGFVPGHTFTASEIQSLSQEQQRDLAQVHLVSLLDTYSKTETPTEFALAAYNAGEGNINDSYPNFYEWANHLLKFPKAWIAQSGLGYQTVTYVLRNKYLMDHPEETSWPGYDELYHQYLGWPRMPIPADFGHPAGITWESRPASIYDIPDNSVTEFQGFGEATPAAGLATGGIVSQPTIAVIGEGDQNEAVIPLDDWNRDQERRHGESITELREIVRKVEELIRVAEDGGLLSAAMGR